MRLLVEFNFLPFFALSSHTVMQIVFLVTKMLQMYFSNMSYFPNMSYFVRVGARGSLFTGTLWFCNGCQTFLCWGRTESSSSCAWFPLWIICNQSEQQAFLIVLFVCVCMCVWVSEWILCPLCRNETDYCCQIKCLLRELHSVFVMNLHSCSHSLHILRDYLICFCFLAMIEAASPTLFGHSL